MGTTAQKLTYLNDTKELLKDTINYTGAGITNETFREYPKELYNEYCNILKDDSALFNGMPKFTGTGTSATINNTADSRMAMSLAPSKMEQASTTGKNKLPILDGTITKNGITITVENGIVNINGTSTGGLNIKLTNGLASSSGSSLDSDWLNETCINDKNNTTISINHISGTGATSDCAFRVYDETTSHLNQYYPYASLQTTTYNESGKISCVVFFTGNNKTFDNYKFTLQLEDGTTATDFEKFTYGASPNPDYPQDIHTISGNNTITVSNSDNTKSQILPLNLGDLEYCKIGNYADVFMKPSGKNLFDGEIEAGYLNINTGADVSGSNVRTKNYIKIQPDTQYTISDNNQGKDTWACYYNKDKVFISSQQIKVYASQSGTFTTPNNAYYMRWYNSASTGTTPLWQLEKGSSATEYEPYNNGKWYLKKNIGKVVLNGSENWSNYSYAFQTNDYKSSINLAISDNFIYSTAWSSTSETYRGKFNLNSTTLRFMPTDTSITTTQQWQTWLSTHNTIVYYLLATPTYTLLNDTLQEELDNISKALSYKDQTNISQINDDLPFVISYSCIKDVSEVFE